jgi:pilus assembly protein Flp/PilA
VGNPPVRTDPVIIRANEKQELLPMTSRISRFSKGLWKHEEGATAIEYGLIAALIAVVIIAAVAIVGTDLSNMFNTVSGQLN